MKHSRLHYFVIVITCAIFCCSTMMAQDDIKIPKYSFLIQEVVKIDCLEKYTDWVKNIKTLMQKDDFPFSSSAYVLGPNKFIYSIGLQSVGDFTDLMQEFDKMIAKGGPEVITMMQNNAGNLLTTESALHENLISCWYMPVEGAYIWNPDESCYVFIAECKVKIGKEHEFELVLQKIHDLLKEKKATLPLAAGKVIIGPHLYWVAHYAKTKDDLDKQWKETSDLIGSEFTDLIQNTTKLLDDITKKDFNYNPKFSYYPVNN